MANRFYQNFTLTDIFNNRALANKIPLINYKETEKADGKIMRRTNLKTVTKEVYDTSVRAARPFYKNIVHRRQQDIIDITGEMIGNHDDAVDAVYNALLAKKDILRYTANDSEMIRSALKEAEKNKRKTGLKSKLYLRINSMQQLQGMSNMQIRWFMKDVIDNILYGDNFPETQKKFNVDKMYVQSPFDYEQRKFKWKMKVGD